MHLYKVRDEHKDYLHEYMPYPTGKTYRKTIVYMWPNMQYFTAHNIVLLGLTHNRGCGECIIQPQPHYKLLLFSLFSRYYYFAVERDTNDLVIPLCLHSDSILAITVYIRQV